MHTVHSLLVKFHIIIGAAALVLFWIPIFARKGSLLHTRIGNVYAIAMYVVSITGFVASMMVLADPIGIRRPGMDLDLENVAELAEQFRTGSLFLLMLSVLVFSSVHHGLMAVRERHSPGILKTPWHRGMIISLGLLGVLVSLIGFQKGALLLMIFGGLSIFASIGIFRESLPDRLTQKERVIAHLGGLIGSGIGAYTAFFAFGGRHFLAELLPGQWLIVSWVIAPVVGMIAINRLTRKYSGRRSTPVTRSKEAA